MFFLKLLSYVNFKWNCWIGYIHDISAKLGVGHWTVWFYDTFTWSIPQKWQLIGGKRYDEYMLEYELSVANHQISYYSNQAYEWMLAYIDTLPQHDDDKELIFSSVKTEKLKNMHKVAAENR